MVVEEEGKQTRLGEEVEELIFIIPFTYSTFDLLPRPFSILPSALTHEEGMLLH